MKRSTTFPGSSGKGEDWTEVRATRQRRSPDFFNPANPGGGLASAQTRVTAHSSKSKSDGKDRRRSARAAPLAPPRPTRRLSSPVSDSATNEPIAFPSTFAPLAADRHTDLQPEQDRTIILNSPPPLAPSPRNRSYRQGTPPKRKRVKNPTATFQNSPPTPSAAPSSNKKKRPPCPPPYANPYSEGSSADHT